MPAAPTRFRSAPYSTRKSSTTRFRWASLWAGSYPLGFNPILGTAGLVGVAINASIVVLAAIRANPLSASGDPDAIVYETFQPTRHIVSTTLTTVGGFLPLLLFSGGDFWPPLAVVIAGGGGLSISLGLLLTPAVYGLMAPRTRLKTAAATLVRSPA